MMRIHTALLLGGMTLLGGLGMLVSCNEQARTPHGESTYANLDPGVKYTGRESCQSCHKEIYASYLETGMGKSLYRPDPAKAIEEFGAGAVVHDAFSGYSYHPYWRVNDLMMLEFRLEGADTSYQRREKIDYIVGSGHQTRSYLLDRGGYFFEAPITWYVGRKRWDLSPGYENGQNTRFDREIGEECMACHTGKVEFAGTTKNFFTAVSLGIDCEKCHGPGGEHIARMEREEIVDVGEQIDYSIVNPAKLPVSMQIDVCQQCHLQGVNVLKEGHTSVQDYRPGMELSDVYDIYVQEYAGESDFGIASHGQRMMESSCFKGSGGKMSCTTCHDPHRSIASTGLETYNRQCESCHSTKEAPSRVCTGNAQAPMAGDCVGCHMRKAGVNDIPHVTFTDHKIRVLRDTIAATPGAVREFLRLVCMTDSTPAQGQTGRAYLKFFEQIQPQQTILAEAARLLDPSDERSQGHLAFYQGALPKAIRHLEAALRLDPKNLFLKFRLAEAHEASGQNGPAKIAYKEVYESDKRLTEAGQRYGSLILKTATGPEPALTEARKVFEECLQRKPFDHKLHANLGFVELNAGNYPKAEVELLAALATHPDYVLGLENMVLLQLQKGDLSKAKLYLKQLEKFHPDAANLPALRKRVGVGG